VIVGGWAMIADDPFGGEPVAVAPARLAASGGAPSQAMAKPSMTAAANEHDGPDAAAAVAPPPAARTITIIDGTSGKRHDVVIPDSRGQTTEDRRRTSAAGR